MSSPPDQPVDKQSRRHVPALIAIAVALVAAVVAWLFFGVAETEDVTDETTATQVVPEAETPAAIPDTSVESPTVSPEPAPPAPQ